MHQTPLTFDHVGSNLRAVSESHNDQYYELGPTLLCCLSWTWLFKKPASVSLKVF